MLCISSLLLQGFSRCLFVSFSPAVLTLFSLLGKPYCATCWNDVFWGPGKPGRESLFLSALFLSLSLSLSLCFSLSLSSYLYINISLSFSYFFLLFLSFPSPYCPRFPSSSLPHPSLSFSRPKARRRSCAHSDGRCRSRSRR
jgi:hypothetical protein